MAAQATLLAATLRLPPDSAFHDVVMFLPYGLALVGAALGLIFALNRVSFCCTALLGAYIPMTQAFGLAGNASDTVVLAGSALLPWLMLGLYHGREKRVFSLHGAARATAVLGAVVAIMAAGSYVELPMRFARFSEQPLFQPLTERWTIPPIGMAAFAAALPFFLIRTSGASPWLGRFFFVAMLSLFFALNARSSLWTAESRAAVGSAFVSGALLTLIWAVLENAWRSATLDELTGLPGRRALRRHLAALETHYAVAILDLDRFKRVNDRYGHDTGDQALRFVAGHIGKAKSGNAYRYGGEEFVLVYERKPIEAVATELEALRRDLRAKPFAVRGSSRPKRKPGKTNRAAAARRTSAAQPTRSIRLSVSIGLAAPNRKKVRPEDVLRAADKALYNAKKNGRNRLCIAD